MQDEIDKLNERVAWLERKMVRMLWFYVTTCTALCGGMVAYFVDQSFGWPSIVIGFGIWLTLGIIFQRRELRGAPRHIQFIDP
jgi:hypothetical protein